MIRPALVQMFLSSAYLCADPSCNVVSNQSEHCPRCHSSVITLAKVLDRESPENDPEFESDIVKHL